MEVEGGWVRFRLAKIVNMEVGMEGGGGGSGKDR